MTNAILYSRFSPRPDSATSESNAAQLDLNRAYCSRKGYRIVHEFDDPDASGDDENRPGMWAAINSLKRGMVLVVWKMDRLCRSVYLSEFLHREVAKRGARIEAVEGGTHNASPEGVLIRQVLAAFDEFAKKMGAARTSSFMRRHQATGRTMSAAIPYGFREIDPVEVPDPRKPGEFKQQRRHAPDPAEQEIIRRIQALHAEGLGPRAIARRLNQERVPARGSGWYDVSVRRIIARASS